MTLNLFSYDNNHRDDTFISIVTNITLPISKYQQYTTPIYWNGNQTTTMYYK